MEETEPKLIVRASIIDGPRKITVKNRSDYV